MFEWFAAQHPLTQALLGGLFTWAMTAAGAALVLLTTEVNRRLLDAMLGFSAGVMIAASVWSLLVPAIEIAQRGPLPAWLPAGAGFLLGGALIWCVDKVLPHLHLDLPIEEAEGLSTSWRRSVLLVSAITLHNVPEGLAVGVAFGAVASGMEGAGLAAAITLAVGIGIQNFPEGLAVAMPLRGEGLSRTRAFGWGQASGLVEPLFAVIGAAAVVQVAAILPYALGFAAGAMIFVVVEELIPESQRAGNVDLATLYLMLGFTLMMALDVGFG